MKILEKTMEQMPKSFTSNEFNKRAIKNGYPAKNLKIKGLANFIRKYADNAYEGSKTWLKRSAKEKISKVAETQQLNRFAVNTRFSLTDNQIETIADLFSRRECLVVEGQDTEWLLSHAFQLGMKFYRDLLNGC